MPKRNQDPKPQGGFVYRQDLTKITGALFRSGENKEMHAAIWEVLKSNGLHRLTKIDLRGVDEEVRTFIKNFKLA